MKRDRKRPSSAAWIIGIIVFFLAMGVTFSNVYGLDRFEYAHPGYGEGGGALIPPLFGYAPTGPGWFNENMGAECTATAPVSAVPEPMTILLVVIGSGMILVSRRK